MRERGTLFEHEKWPKSTEKWVWKLLLMENCWNYSRFKKGRPLEPHYQKGNETGSQSGWETRNGKKFSRILVSAMRTASLRALKWAPTWYVSAEVWNPFNGQPLDQVWIWYEMSAETYRVGAHFKALIKAILVALSRILENFFSFHLSLPRCAESMGDDFFVRSAHCAL